MKPLTRIPLTIEVVDTGYRTEGVLVGVMVRDLDALELFTTHFGNRAAVTGYWPTRTEKVRFVK